MTRRSEVPVADPQGLAKELQQVVDERFQGTASKAAEAAGLKQPHFARLLAGSYDTITVATARKLRQLLPEDRRERFDVVVMGEATLTLMRTAYRDWLQEAQERPFHAQSAFFQVREGILTTAEPDQVVLERAAVYAVIMREAFQEFFSYLNPLIELIKEGRHTDRRQGVSLVRIFEPLLEHYNSAFVERGWHELSWEDQRRFVEAGVRRELILLDRDPAYLRAAALFLPDVRRKPSKARKGMGEDG